MDKLVTVKNTKSGRVAARLDQEIHQGRYVPGTFLPSERQMAESYQVSVMTMRKCLDALCRKGRLVKLPQRGVMVPSRAAVRAEVAQIAYITQALAGDSIPYIKGMNEAIDHDRFSLATYVTQSNLDRYRRQIENVVRQHPAGVVLGTTFKEQHKVQGELLSQAGIPVVTLGQETVPHLACDAVRDSARDGAARVARFIAGRGYRDLAFLTTSVVSSGETISTLREELSPNGVALPEDRILLFEDPHGYADLPNPCIDAEDAMAGRLAKGFRCECLICGCDYMAVGALRAILKAGISVPGRMKVISVLKDASEGMTPLRVTTVDSHREYQGRLAVQVLTRRIDGLQGPVQVHYVSTDLVEGETT